MVPSRTICGQRRPPPNPSVFTATCRRFARLQCSSWPKAGDTLQRIKQEKGSKKPSLTIKSRLPSGRRYGSKAACAATYRAVFKLP